MSKHPHTPGPWFAHTSPPSDAASVWAEAESHLENAAAVAHCADNYDQRRPVSECQANARLIAAAPELLTALRDLYELCTFGASADAFRNGVTDSTGMIDEGDVRASDRLCAARAAIAAAEGRR